MKQDCSAVVTSVVVKQISFLESEATSVVPAGPMSNRIPFITGRISSSSVAYMVLEMPSIITCAGKVTSAAVSSVPPIWGYSSAGKKGRVEAPPIQLHSK